MCGGERNPTSREAPGCFQEYVLPATYSLPDGNLVSQRRAPAALSRKQCNLFSDPSWDPGRDHVAWSPRPVLRDMDRRKVPAMCMAVKEIASQFRCKNKFEVSGMLACRILELSMRRLQTGTRDLRGWRLLFVISCQSCVETQCSL